MDQSLGSYGLLRLLGQGGMGEVYLAEGSDGEQVAIKTLLPSVLEDEGRRKRFLRELRLIGRLERHEHIVEVREVLLRPEVPRDAVVMEWLDGPSLRDRLQDGPLEVGYALRLARQMASALAHVHAHGLVHRDFKPSNLVLADQGRRIVLLDFGIAKEVRRLEDVTRITETGQVLGTAEYMAPEQVQGGEVGPGGDMFAFGVVLYQMLTGISPFRGSTPVETSVNTLYHHPVPVDRQRDLIPTAVADLVERLMAKLPTDRPASMELVVEELEMLIRRPSARGGPNRRKKWLLRAVVALVLGALVLGVVAVSLGWWSIGHGKPSPDSRPDSTTEAVASPARQLPPALAVLPFAGEPGPGAVLSLALAERLQGSGLRVVDPSTVAGALQDLELTVDAFDPDKHGSRLLTYLDAASAVGGRIRTGGAGSLLQVESWWIGDGASKALDSFSGTLPVELSARLTENLRRESILSAPTGGAGDRLPHQVAARVPFALGVLDLGRGEPWSARQQLEEARHLDPDSPVIGVRLAEALLGLRLVDQAHSVILEALELKPEGLTADEAAAIAAESEGRSRTAARHWKEFYDRAQSDPEAGRRRLEAIAEADGPGAALAMLDELHGPNGPHSRRGGLAVDRSRTRLLLQQGRYADALESADTFLGRARKLGARRSEALALLYRGIALQGLGRAQEATAEVEQAWASLAAVDDPLLEAQALEWTGILLTAGGQPAAAVPLHRRTRQIYGELSDLGGKGFEVLDAIAQVGEAMALHSLGHPDEAEPLLDEAGRVLEQAGALREAGRSRINLGVIHHLSGRLDSAATLYAAGLDLASRADDTETKAGALTNLGEIELTLGDPVAALDLLHQALAIYVEDRQVDDRIYVQLQIGEAHLQNGDSTRAQAAFREARRLASSTDPPDTASVEQAENGLTRARK